MAPALTPSLPAHAESTIVRFLRAHVAEAGANGLVLGLSGGIDSALVARLARDALGAENVWALSLPTAGYPADLRRETRDYARGLGISFEEVPVTGLQTAFSRARPAIHDRVALGNVTARLRMTLLHAEAAERRALVAGTGNKSELLLGYFTKYGDGGVDLLPIGDLYKTSVWELARRLDLPRAIIERRPSAGLWPGQTDEGELGLPYTMLDRILTGLERLLEPEEIAPQLRLPLKTVRGVAERVRRNRHKRRLPPIPKLGTRTVGLDWRD